MKKRLKIVALATVIGIFGGLSSCDEFEGSPSATHVGGIVQDASTNQPIKGVYLALIEKKDCDWLGEECEGYNILDEDYSTESGNYSLGYYGSSTIFLVVKRSEVAVFVDSLNEYRMATVMAFQCPSISDVWNSTVEINALDYYAGISVYSNDNLNVNVKLEFKE